MVMSSMDDDAEYFQIKAEMLQELVDDFMRDAVRLESSADLVERQFAYEKRTAAEHITLEIEALRALATEEEDVVREQRPRRPKARSKRIRSAA